MASATGLPCKVDPALVSALRSQKSGNYLVFDKLILLLNNAILI
jgi:hypothetical protein